MPVRWSRVITNAPTTASVVRRLHARRRQSPAYLEGERAVLTPLPLEQWPTSALRSRPVTPARVLHIVTNALPEIVAGYTVRTHCLAATQRAQGIDAQVVTRLGFPVTKGYVDAAATEDVSGVPYHRLIAPVPLRAEAARAADIRQTAALAERLQPDVLHAHSNHLNAQVALAVGRLQGLPVVYEVRGFLEETWVSRGHSPDAESYRLTRATETWAMRHADAIVTLSESMRAEIVSRGIDPAKVTIAPNAVDEDLVRERPAAIHPTTYTIGTVGTLNHYEGLDLMLAAAARVAAAGIPVRVLVVGDGPARADLESQAALLGLDATFTGRVAPDDVRRHYRQLDVFCLPRRDLPVTRLVPPLKPLEAMACGIPVIASDLPPLRELVADGRTGLLVPAGDVEALAEAIGTLARRADARAQLGAGARDFVATQRTWTAVHHTLTEVYASLTQGVTA